MARTRRRGSRRRRTSRSRSSNTATTVVALLLVSLAVFLYARGEADADGRPDTDILEPDSPPTTAPATTAPATTAPAGGGGSTKPPEDGGERATDLLAALSVEGESGAGTYQRDHFGEGWGPAGHGCNVRDEVLAVESTVDVTRGSDGCTVTAGNWVSLYDGYSTPDPDELEVDHLVPLAEAWASGARAWPEARRVAYANDTRHADALIAVTVATNQAKKDKDPAEWMPSKRDSWCRYASAWVTQKYAWRLSIDRSEKTALTNVLATC